jgi:hypothetical protein
MLKRFGIKQFASKTVLLSALLATGATVIAQGASSVTLELFNTTPNESSQATASLEIGSGGGNLKGIETPEKAGKARYLRAKVATASGVENYVYRVIGNPNNGRIFIITPERKAIALNKFLASTGLEVGADKTVKLGSQVDFASTNATVMESGSSTSQVAGSTTEASTTSTTASTAPVETTTPASTTATYSSTIGSTPADASTAAPTTPADSSTASTEAAALTAPVSITVGKVELTVIPAGATAPASTEKNLILAPVTDATDAKSSVEGNMVTLSYTSSSSIDDVSKFYDDQLKAQGFTPDESNATNQKSADQFVKVYKRGTASMTMSVKTENGAYQVEVDLDSLANGN